jgi:predicted transposase YbfD/YdcC
LVTAQKARDFVDSEISQATTIDADHGRIETRTTTVIHDVEWLRKRHDWPGLKAVVMVESTREIAGKAEQETRFYITSLVMLAHLLGPAVRSHWATLPKVPRARARGMADEGNENSPHWVMDMIFRNDEYHLRTNHALANFTTIKHMAHNLLRRPSGKDSFRLRRKVAGWHDEFLASLVTA